MSDGNIRQVLAGRKALVVGIANGPVDLNCWHVIGRKPLTDQELV